MTRNLFAMSLCASSALTLWACTASSDGGSGSTKTNDTKTDAADEATTDDAATADTNAPDADATADTTDATDDGTSNPVDQTVTFSGTVVLNANISSGNAHGLTPGSPVAGATVFVKGLPTQATTTDAQGAFTIAVDTSGMQFTDSHAYSVVTWFTTTDVSPAKFGLQTDVTADPAVTASMGTLSLGFTQRVQFYPQENGTNIANFANICTVTFPDYTGKLVVNVVGSDLQADYLPPATYEINVACTGYTPKTTTFTIADPGTANPPNWTAINVPMTHL